MKDVFEVEALKEMEEEYLKTVGQLFIRCVALPGVTKDLWTEENERALVRFIVDTTITTMVVYKDTNARLRVEYSIPSPVAEFLNYFIRKPGSKITAETFDKVVQFGSVRGDPAKSLLNKMAYIHAPAVALHNFRDKNIKDDYTNNMHCYLLNLTDDVNKKEGKTVLYVPMECQQFSPEDASKDKKLLFRMETVMIHWTNQVKEVLNEQKVKKNMRDTRGPLQEIAFWKSHSDKLLHISWQLQKPGVLHIKNILQLSKSIYVEGFSDVAKKLQEYSVEAKSNHAFLSILKEPCEELAQLKPSQVAPKLKHIFSLIRIIWTNSPYFNTDDMIINLFHEINYEVVSLCIKSISLDSIFTGYVFSSKQNLSDCTACCLSLKNIYMHTKKIHQK